MADAQDGVLQSTVVVAGLGDPADGLAAQIAKAEAGSLRPGAQADRTALRHGILREEVAGSTNSQRSFVLRRDTLRLVLASSGTL